jgi:hypothetical protein
MQLWQQLHSAVLTRLSALPRPAPLTAPSDRILGAHFFSPAHIMPLLEIVRTDRTSKQVRREGRGQAGGQAGGRGMGAPAGCLPVK